jgi:hypothetical protein
MQPYYLSLNALTSLTRSGRSYFLFPISTHRHPSTLSILSTPLPPLERVLRSTIAGSRASSPPRARSAVCYCSRAPSPASSQLLPHPASSQASLPAVSQVRSLAPGMLSESTSKVFLHSHDYELTSEQSPSPGRSSTASP